MFKMKLFICHVLFADSNVAHGTFTEICLKIMYVQLNEILL